MSEPLNWSVCIAHTHEKDTVTMYLARNMETGKSLFSRNEAQTLLNLLKNADNFTLVAFDTDGDEVILCCHESQRKQYVIVATKVEVA